MLDVVVVVREQETVSGSWSVLIKYDQNRMVRLGGFSIPSFAC